MPYRITRDCSGKETICEDSCPYGAIEEAKAAGVGRLLQIDPELCTDCGACALACPEAAIRYAIGAAHATLRQPAPTRTFAIFASRPERNAHQPDHGAEMEMPESIVIVDGKPEPWAELMAACCD